MHVVLLTTQKSSRAKKKFHNARSLQENTCNARSAAYNQSMRRPVPGEILLFKCNWPMKQQVWCGCQGQHH